MGRYKRRKASAEKHGQFVNSGYGDFAASHTRQSFSNFRASSLSPHRDIIRHIKTLRSRARSLYMSAPLATSAIKNLRTSVVGRGLHLHVKIDYEQLGLTREEAAEWGRNVEKEFDLWAESKTACDIRGLHDFYELQQLALVAWKMSGDAFCLFRQGKTDALNPYTLRLQLLEADRVSTPGTALYHDGAQNYGELENGNKVYDGVEVNAAGEVVAYHVASNYFSEGEQIEWVRIEKKGKQTGMPNILHLMDAERPEQLRGVPFITPVMESIMQLSRYLQAEAVAALMETYHSGYIITDSLDSNPMSGAAPGVEGEEGAEEEERDVSDLAPEPGAMFKLLPGEDVKFNDPKRPSSQFDPFTTAQAKYIGAALEIPADVLLKCYNSSYSASRAALQDFWNMVRMTRDWFGSDFCGAVYAEWLAEAVARGRVNAPGFFTDPRTRKAWLGHEWNGAAMPHLDPTKEANALSIAVQHGWMTNTQATTHLNGGDWERNIEELQIEAKKQAVVNGILQAALAIKQQGTGENPEISEENTEKEGENEQ